MAAPPLMPRMFGFCPRCEWSGFAADPLGHIAVSFDNQQTWTQEGITFSCPNCQQDNVIRAVPRDRIDRDLAGAIRRADLSAETLAAILEVGRANPTISPRDLAARVPGTSNVVTVAARHGKDWLPTLLALVSVMVTIHFGQQAHVDAQQAPAGANEGRRVQSTSELTHEDLRQIAAQVDAYDYETLSPNMPDREIEAEGDGTPSP